MTLTSELSTDAVAVTFALLFGVIGIAFGNKGGDDTARTAMTCAEILHRAPTGSDSLAIYRDGCRFTP